MILAVSLLFGILVLDNMVPVSSLFEIHHFDYLNHTLTPSLRADLKVVAKECIFTNAMCMNNMISSKCGQKYLFEVNLWGTKTILKPACALAEKICRGGVGLTHKDC